MNLLTKFSFLFLLFLCGCTKISDKTAQDSHLLPPNAQNVEYLNDRWGKFELNGQTYYFTTTNSNISLSYFPVNSTEEKTKEPESPKEPVKFKCPNCGVHIIVTDLGPAALPVHKE